MANRSNAKTVDSAVIERRLRPIYDNLDIGNNKRAAQEADKALRKQPDLLCAQVLKGLALLRLGKEQESFLLLDKVLEIGTADDATLQALTVCFKELQKPAEICKMYASATKLEPQNEELLSHLFMSYVRVGDYKNQKSTAMQLCKLTRKNPYFYWAVMSIIMESSQITDETTRGVTVQLAMRMMDKYISEGKLESAEEFMLYIFILEKQGQSEKILEVLDSDTACQINQRINYIAMTKGEHLTLLNRHMEAANVYKDLIIAQSDNWQHYENYIDASIEQHVQNEGTVLADASQFLVCCSDMASEGKTRDRSPWLSILQLALKLSQKSLSDQIMKYCGSPVNHISNYVEHFGDKMCCYGDIVNFLPLIKQEEVVEFLKKADQCVQEDGNGLPAMVRDMYRHQLWIQLSVTLGDMDNFNAAEHIKWADTLLQMYFDTAHFSSKMEPTDIRPNDTYLIIAAQSYLTAVLLYQDGDSSVPQADIPKLIIYICTALEHGLDISKANFQFKLLLIKAYNLIGAPEAGSIAYDKLELKHIQLDTLGYVMTFQSLDMGHYLLATDIFASTLKFFLSNTKETADSIIMAYKYGSLTRIPEFIQFRDRLANSIQFASVSLEHMVLELTASGSTDLREIIRNSDLDMMIRNIRFDRLSDNRDLKVMNNWLPKQRQLSQSQKEQTFKDESLMLQIRFCMMKILYACVVPEATNVCPGKEDISNLICQLEELQQNCDQYKSKILPKMPIQAPDVPRIYSYAKCPYVQCFLAHASLVANLYICSTKPEEYLPNGIDNCRKLSSELFEEAKASISALQCAAATASPLGNRDKLVQISHTIQTVSFVSILLTCSHGIFQTLKSQKKKKRKTKFCVNEQLAFMNSYITEFIKELQQLESNIRQKHVESGVVNAENLVRKFNDFNLRSNIGGLSHQIVCDDIEKSLSEILSCMILAVGSKVKFLNSLKL